ncbi:MAG: hypothetical protein K9G28_04420, partial [Candidatus Nanopelagicales bacterium]|nr:hypothetical protein [Candidatus Nanopelagicales bacterium]
MVGSESEEGSGAVDSGSVESALDAVVEAIGGQRRTGQQQMADLVADALSHRSHAVVQAGTGTGKSVAYL